MTLRSWDQLQHLLASWGNNSSFFFFFFSFWKTALDPPSTGLKAAKRRDHSASECRSRPKTWPLELHVGNERKARLHSQVSHLPPSLPPSPSHQQWFQTLQWVSEWVQSGLPTSSADRKKKTRRSLPVENLAPCRPGKGSGETFLLGGEPGEWEGPVL